MIRLTSRPILGALALFCAVPAQAALSPAETRMVAHVAFQRRDLLQRQVAVKTETLADQAVGNLHHAAEFFARAHADGVVHAEIFFDPQTHTARGVPFEAVIKGLHHACQRAHQEFGISARLIMCFLRHLPEREAFAKALGEARALLDRGDAAGAKAAAPFASSCSAAMAGSTG